MAYAVAGYEQSIRNAAQVTLASDNVFSDGSSLELATMTGGVERLYGDPDGGDLGTPLTALQNQLDSAAPDR